MLIRNYVKEKIVKVDIERKNAFEKFFAEYKEELGKTAQSSLNKFIEKFVPVDKSNVASWQLNKVFIQEIIILFKELNDEILMLCAELDLKDVQKKFLQAAYRANFVSNLHAKTKNPEEFSSEQQLQTFNFIRVSIEAINYALTEGLTPDKIEEVTIETYKSHLTVDAYLKKNYSNLKPDQSKGNGNAGRFFVLYIGNLADKAQNYAEELVNKHIRNAETFAVNTLSKIIINEIYSHMRELRDEILSIAENIGLKLSEEEKNCLVIAYRFAFVSRIRAKNEWLPAYKKEQGVRCLKITNTINSAITQHFEQSQMIKKVQEDYNTCKKTLHFVSEEQQSQTQSSLKTGEEEINFYGETISSIVSKEQQSQARSSLKTGEEEIKFRGKVISPIVKSSEERLLKLKESNKEKENSEFDRKFQDLVRTKSVYLKSGYSRLAKASSTETMGELSTSHTKTMDSPSEEDKQARILRSKSTSSVIKLFSLKRFATKQSPHKESKEEKPPQP